MQTPCWTFSITLNQTFFLILAWTPWFSPWSLCTFSPFVCWFFSKYAIVHHSYIKGWWDTTSWPYVWMWVWMVVYLKNWPGCHQSTRFLSPVDGGDRLQLLLRLTSAFLSPLAALTMLCCVCFFFFFLREPTLIFLMNFVKTKTGGNLDWDVEKCKEPKMRLSSGHEKGHSGSFTVC